MPHGLGAFCGAAEAVPCYKAPEGFRAASQGVSGRSLFSKRVAGTGRAGNPSTVLAHRHPILRQNQRKVCPVQWGSRSPLVGVASTQMPWLRKAASLVLLLSCKSSQEGLAQSPGPQGLRRQKIFLQRSRITHGGSRMRANAMPPIQRMPVDSLRLFRACWIKGISRPTCFARSKAVRSFRA